MTALAGNLLICLQSAHQQSRNSLILDFIIFDIATNTYRLIGPVVGKAKNAIRKNAAVAQNQNEYQRRYDEWVKQYEDTKAAYEKTVEQIESMVARNSLLNIFSKELRKQENILTEFDDGMCGGDFMTVHSKKDIEVTFKDGTTLRIE